ncbi:MAG: hypothetical protein QM493_00370 [Sulfurovum sp.]
MKKKLFILILCIVSTLEASKNKKLSLVKENHAIITYKGVKYVMDSYIIPFENPYYISVKRSDKKSIRRKEAIKVSKKYIKPRGCTSSLKHLPKLDRVSKNKTKWIIGISC